jgi:hypothetical protein
MTAMPRCNACGREVPASDWNRPEPLPCSWCESPVQVWVFPAGWTDTQGKPPVALAAEGAASCFHHPANQAEAACGLCGRFVCSVCVDGSGEQAVCRTCFTRGTTAGEPRFRRRATLHDSIGLMIAAFPLLTVFTGPVAAIYTLVTWKKTHTVVPRSNAVKAVALAISALWLAVLVGMIVFLIRVSGGRP